MNLDDLDVHKLMNRLAVIERSDIGERLDYIEKQLKYFVYAATEMKDKFVKGIAVNIDQSSINVAAEIRRQMSQCLDLIRIEASGIRELRNEIQQERRQMFELMKNDSIIGTMQFMAKQIKQLVDQVELIKEEGINKKLHFNLTMDGHEMVKVQPVTDKENLQCELKKLSPDDCIRRLLAELYPREATVLIHRFGLFGEKCKTYVGTGRIMQLSGSRISTIQAKALRKCRMPSKKLYVDNLPIGDLKKAITGE